MNEIYESHIEDPKNGHLIDQETEIETRPTMPGEIGYSLDGTAVTALTEETKKKIGDTDREVNPAVLSSPVDLDVHGNAFIK